MSISYILLKQSFTGRQIPPKVSLPRNVIIAIFPRGKYRLIPSSTELKSTFPRKPQTLTAATCPEEANRLHRGKLFQFIVRQFTQTVSALPCVHVVVGQGSCGLPGSCPDQDTHHSWCFSLFVQIGVNLIKAISQGMEWKMRWPCMQSIGLGKLA